MMSPFGLIVVITSRARYPYGIERFNQRAKAQTMSIQNEGGRLT